MAMDQRLDELLSKWLEETAPQRVPTRVLAATFERTRGSKQQVRWPARTGKPPMARFATALGGAAVVAVAAVLVINTGLITGPGGTPTPTPSATASPSTSPRPAAPPVGAEVTELLDRFLEARIAGGGAETFIYGAGEDVPLLYATTSGARYERAEFAQVLGYEWPYGFAAFKVRLFSRDTVVEQLFFTPQDLTLYPDPSRAAEARGTVEYVVDGFGTDIAPTTEDGRAVGAPYVAFDGVVTVHVSHPWAFRGGRTAIRLIPEGAGPTTDGGERNGWDRLVLMANPTRTGTCPTDGGPVDAEGLVESIRSDPGLDATAPVAVSAAGAEGLMLDVAIADGASQLCAGLIGDTELGFRQGVGLSTGSRMRLYVYDAPDGSSLRILAIAIVVPESRWERAVGATTPAVLVEFHTP